jgi:hypothetical protein
MLRTSIINFISKIGLIVPFLYTLFITFLDPQRIVVRWPDFLSRHVNENALVLITGLVSVSIVIWIFSNRLKFAAAAAALISMSLVLITNITDPKLLFESVPAFCLALGLTLRYYPRIRVIAGTKVTRPTSHTYKKADGTQVEMSDHDQHLFVPENK